MNIASRRLTQEKDGIPGWIAYPHTSDPHPGIMMLHHAYGVTGDYKADASALAQLGFTVFVPAMYNMLGAKGNYHVESGPPFNKKHSDAEFLKVIGDAWKFLTSRSDTDAKRCAVTGHCLGGRLGILFAADTPQVSALVLYYATIRDEPVSELRPRHSFDAGKLVKCPTLVLYGGRDRLTSNKSQLQLWQSFLEAGAPVEWHYFSEANHGFAGQDADEYQPQYTQLVWPLVTEFLLRRLSERAS